MRQQTPTRRWGMNMASASRLRLTPIISAVISLKAPDTILDGAASRRPMDRVRSERPHQIFAEAPACCLQQMSSGDKVESFLLNPHLLHTPDRRLHASALYLRRPVTPWLLLHTFLMEIRLLVLLEPPQQAVRHEGTAAGS